MKHSNLDSILKAMKAQGKDGLHIAEDTRNDACSLLSKGERAQCNVNTQNHSSRPNIYIVGGYKASDITNLNEDK